jgi:hypothetical protein
MTIYGRGADSFPDPQVRAREARREAEARAELDRQRAERAGIGTERTIAAPVGRSASRWIGSAG